MKKYHNHIGITSVVLTIISLLAYRLNAKTLTNPPPPLPDSFVLGLEVTNSQESHAISNRVAYLNQFSNETTLRAAYDNGIISRGEFMWVRMQWENAKSQDIYGKVVDQDGNPIAGVEVTGRVARRQGWYMDDKWVEYKTQTDANGLFQFIGLRGADWGVIIEKEGYEMDYRIGWNGPRGGPRGSQTSPNNRAILTMWKIKGAEPMVHVKIGVGIACDGTPTRFDLLSGKRSPDGDLIVKLTRNPVNIDRRKPFNWSVTLKIPNGGFQEITNIYPYEAPAEGYQSEVTYDFHTNAPDWTLHFTPALYFKSQDGRIYGRMTLNIMANFQPPPTYFGAEIYANPAGSRNLEFDPQKQIR